MATFKCCQAADEFLMLSEEQLVVIVRMRFWFFDDGCGGVLVTPLAGIVDKLWE